MVKIVWTEPALDDIHSIMEFIAQDSVYYADATARGILDAPKRIRKYPLSGRIVPEFCDTTIREVIYNSYRIFTKLLIQVASLLQSYTQVEILYGTSRQQIGTNYKPLFANQNL